MRMLIIFFFLAACVLMALGKQTVERQTVGQQTADSPLLETGKSSKPEKLAAPAKEICIVSYNIRWRTGDELKTISEWMSGKLPSIVALQEVDRAKKRTNKSNNARALAEQLGMNYAWAAPPLPKSDKDEEEETGVE